MTIVISIISSVLVATIVPIIIKWGIKRKNKKETYDENNNKVRIVQFYEFYRIVLIIGAIIFNVIIQILIYMFPYDCKGYEIYMCLLFWISLGFPTLFLAIIWNMWKIEVHKEYFIYRGYFGKKSKHYYSEVILDSHRRGPRWYFKKDGKKICSFHPMEVDCSAIVNAYFKYFEKERRREAVARKLTKK
jgi:hypothetical protein